MSRAIALLLLVAGCQDHETSPSPDMAMMAEPLAIACTDSKADVFTLPSNLPPFDASRRGDVFRCGFEEHVTAAQANAALKMLGYQGAAVGSGMDVYRIAFRTERVGGSDADGGITAPEGYSAARVFLPDQRRTDAFVVTAHGTLGEADSCADSQKDILDPTLTQSAKIMDLALAGDGFIVIEPDGAGYGYGQAPAGWSLAEDEAHGILDATRALANVILPSALPSKVAFVGHSQGSHAVLSAQAYARSYGMHGQLVGVAPLALLWITDLSWGASVTPLAGLATQSDAAALAYGMYYFYAHGELYDGPGGGLAMFAADKRAQVQSLMTSRCEDDAQTWVPTLGTGPADFYDPTFISDVGDCMVFDQGCDDPLAAKWRQRAIADRPAIDPDSAPIVIWHGAKDTDISPARAQCGFDKLTADLAAASAPTTTLTICGDAQADHSGVVERDIDWVARWVGTRAAGQPDPPGCPGTAPLQPPGGTLTCATPPPND
jgi:hypothetical protein